MEPRVLYTGEAEKRRERLVNEYIQNLESLAVSGKRVPGDKTVELTANDLESAARRFGRPRRQENLRVKIAIQRVWIVAGVGALVVGALYKELVVFASNEPVQLAIILAGFSLASYGWLSLGFLQSAKDVATDSDATLVEEYVRRLRDEIKGRTTASLGYLLGGLSVRPNSLEPVDRERLEEAVELCWDGYNNLKGFGVAEYMALNNLVYFLSVLGDYSEKEFVLDKARELRAIGQENNSSNLLLTYCRAVLRYEDSTDALQEARKIAAAFETSPKISVRLRKEAALYVTAIGERLDKLTEAISHSSPAG